MFLFKFSQELSRRIFEQYTTPKSFFIKQCVFAEKRWLFESFRYKITRVPTKFEMLTLRDHLSIIVLIVLANNTKALEHFSARGCIKVESLVY